MRGARMGFLDRLHARGKSQRLRPDDLCPCGSGKTVKLCCPELLKA